MAMAPHQVGRVTRSRLGSIRLRSEQVSRGFANGKTDAFVYRSAF